MSRDRRRCCGCRTPLGDTRTWCAPCETRLPSGISDQLSTARRAMDHAATQAKSWLATHPRIGARELEAVACLARGLTTAEIATEMHIEESTVKTSLDRTMQRWGCRSRAQLVASAYRLGYLQVTPKGGVAS